MPFPPIYPPFRRIFAAACWAPLAAASPLFAIGFAAHLAGSPANTWYIEAAFDLLALAWPASVLVGIPLYLLLARFRVARWWVVILAGVAVALAALYAASLVPAQVLEDDDGLALTAEDPGAWWDCAICLAYGALVGALVAWRLRRSRPMGPKATQGYT